jgi:hypothetical protein
MSRIWLLALLWYDVAVFAGCAPMAMSSEPHANLC